MSRYHLSPRHTLRQLCVLYLQPDPAEAELTRRSLAPHSPHIALSIVASVDEILARTGLPPELLELELTESMIMGHEAQAVERLGQLRELGVRLAIDDFGTGYSSLSYLKNLPIEILKIDQSFVRGIPQDHDDMKIAAGIIALARKLKLKVLAEGVETADQLAFLAEQGCDSYQGYLYSRPLPAGEFAKLLRTPQ